MNSTTSANDLGPELQRGLIPLSIFAVCSALSTFTLLAWITYRLIFRHEYQSFVGYNQYVILIYNLLLADLQQALAFIITLHWLNIGRIDSPSVTCFAQGWLLNLGDVSSGIFVLAIALHTWYSVVLGRKLQYWAFTIGILAVWAFALLLTLLGPATKGPRFFAKTNAWCWIDQKYDFDRLWLHYMWVFVVEFGTIIIYAHVFYHLRKRLNSIREVAGHDPSGPRRTARLSQAARYMVLYPVIYVVLTLPLAAGRMASMAGRHLPLSYYCMAGSFLTSCGWLDTLLYTLTRRVFVKSESTQRENTRPPTANTVKTQGSARRWLKGKDAEDTEPMPHVADSTWHLSTFASVNMDFKDSSTPGNAISECSSEDEQHTDIENQPYVRTHTPLGRSTPAPEPKAYSLTSTVIQSTADENGPVRLPSDNVIMSETKIEVVSVLRDDLLGGIVRGGLSERSGKSKDLSEKASKS